MSHPAADAPSQASGPSVRPSRVIIIAGAVLAFLIGSGFATGQEILQYFASYGYWGVFGTGALVAVLMSFVCIQFILVGRSHRFEHPSDVFRALCGRVIGTAFDWFSIVFIFMSFWVMIAGASAVAVEQFGLPGWVGGVVIAALVGVTALAGLTRLVDVIGSIGPVIAIVAVALGITAIVRHPSGIADGVAALPGLDVTHASSSWWLAAISYVGFCMLWLAAFLAALGPTTNSRREAALGAGLGGFLFAVACAVVALGLLSEIRSVAGTQIPMLAIAKDVSPALAWVVSVIVLAGIFTTAVPLLWTVASRLFIDGTRRFRIGTAVLAALGTVVGLLVPFDWLVNKVYVINGYVGGILLAVMIVRAIVLAVRGPRGERRSEATAQSGAA